MVWAKLSAAPVFRTDGSVQMFFAQLIDITERKEHEARFEHDVNDAVWLGRIREAIDADRLVLYTQPIVDLRTGETVQQELLLRLCAEDGSIVGPSDFLPVAERYGLISELDRWVIRQAVALAARGQAVEFNLSAMSVGDPAVLHELASALIRTGADPALVVVEVTETAMMDQVDAGRRFAEQIAALGCRLALDDFGTGYASLSYLKQIPAQHLKIDIEFVRDLTRSDTDERLVRGIIGIAREFDQITIAEGIADQATLVRLRELGADFGQGYFLGRPEPLADATPKAATEPRSDPPVSDRSEWSGPHSPPSAPATSTSRRCCRCSSRRRAAPARNLRARPAPGALSRARRSPRLRQGRRHRVGEPEAHPHRLPPLAPRGDRLRSRRRGLRNRQAAHRRPLGLGPARRADLVRRGLPDPAR